MASQGRSYFAPEPRSASSISTTYERDDDEVPGLEHDNDLRGAGSKAVAESAPFLPNGASGNGGPTIKVDLGRIGSASSGADDPAGRASKGQGLSSILAYCMSSIMMTVANKFIVLDKKFNLNLAVLLMQSLIGVALVIIARRLGWISLRGLNRKDAGLWMPISVLLVFVIYTGSKALQHLNVSVYTIFKNLTIVLIAYGERIWFKGRLTALTLLSFLLMVVSSIIAAWADLSQLAFTKDLPYPHLSDSHLSGGTWNPMTGEFVPTVDGLKVEQDRINQASKDALGLANNDPLLDSAATPLGGASAMLNSGYVWMALNCLCSASYVLLMRKQIKMTGFKDWDSMYYNNLLSIPILLLLSLLVEKWTKENFDSAFPQDKRAQLFAAIGFSGACAMLISWSTAWCIRVTSSTTYSMVGALNKLPLALSGMIFFKEKATAGNGIAIAVGSLAGIVYASAKMKQSSDQQQASGGSAATGYSRLGTGALRSEGVIPMHKLNGDGDPRRD
ncbi:UDP-galactose transporter [Tilletiaria anomala UBC 951]|uniref:GDP-mannose transporter n=1 Tax=Tilletiaria anomala (strain ATCC 24038 / CBS 436.72 / UBC 951) TaxID=1037660 RepID=A0A066WBL7_TILAU|nr:UDP-galactose transporter [Tilletiaria anomala UBC 951]KDN48479.1 UDP-galactose transporter [Tilletiaria anomala UBC 951]